MPVVSLRFPTLAETAISKAKTLEDAFLETLGDVYYAEKQAVRMLQKASKPQSLRSCKRPLPRIEDRK